MLFRSMQFLTSILTRGELTSLKGIALEVDTKPIPRIIEDFTNLKETLSEWEADAGRARRTGNEMRIDGNSSPEGYGGITEADRDRLSQDYSNLVLGVTTDSPALEPHSDLSVTEEEGWRTYSRSYLQYEILEWGGNVKEMFPETCAGLEKEGIELSRFTTFWFQEPRGSAQPYDFFLLKIRVFVEFVRLTLPAYRSIVEKEAQELIDGYELANQL